MIASLAVIRAIKKITDIEAEIKWPNDVLIRGKKVCGILIESELKGNRVGYAIISIGMNVNMKVASFPEIAEIATSLADELGRYVSRRDVVRYLLTDLERLYLNLPDGEKIYEEWRDRLVTLGKRVIVSSGTSVMEGVAGSVDRDGALWLRRANGSSTRIVAGDVTLRHG